MPTGPVVKSGRACLGRRLFLWDTWLEDLCFGLTTREVESTGSWNSETIVMEDDMLALPWSCTKSEPLGEAFGVTSGWQRRFGNGAFPTFWIKTHYRDGAESCETWCRFWSWGCPGGITFVSDNAYLQGTFQPWLGERLVFITKRSTGNFESIVGVRGNFATEIPRKYISDEIWRSSLNFSSYYLTKAHLYPQDGETMGNLDEICERLYGSSF